MFVKSEITIFIIYFVNSQVHSIVNFIDLSGY